MICIKCGRKVQANQVFCDECHEDMEAYPVKPGTPIQLPVHTAQPDVKVKAARVRKPLPPEIRLRKMRTTIRLLSLALVAALLAFLLMSCLAMYLLDQRDGQLRFDQPSPLAAQMDRFT